MKNKLIESSIDYANTDQRAELAEKALQTLKTQHGVSDARLYGSLIGADADEYSDIDITVTLVGVEDRAFAESLPEVFRFVGPPLIEGWGLGFLPDMYIRSLYFENLPLFWHIDICCLSDLHVGGADIKSQYHWQQIYKMWVACVKRYIRGESSIDSFIAHIARKHDVSKIIGDEANQLSLLLDFITARTKERGVSDITMQPLPDRCYALSERFLRQHAWYDKK